MCIVGDRVLAFQYHKYETVRRFYLTSWRKPFAYNNEVKGNVELFRENNLKYFHKSIRVKHSPDHRMYFIGCSKQYYYFLQQLCIEILCERLMSPEANTGKILNDELILHCFLLLLLINNILTPLSTPILFKISIRRLRGLLPRPDGVFEVSDLFYCSLFRLSC